MYVNIQDEVPEGRGRMKAWNLDENRQEKRRQQQPQQVVVPTRGRYRSEETEGPRRPVPPVAIS